MTTNPPEALPMGNDHDLLPHSDLCTKPGAVELLDSAATIIEREAEIIKRQHGRPGGKWSPFVGRAKDKHDEMLRVAKGLRGRVERMTAATAEAATESAQYFQDVATRYYAGKRGRARDVRDEYIEALEAECFASAMELAARS